MSTNQITIKTAHVGVLLALASILLQTGCKPDRPGETAR